MRNTIDQDKALITLSNYSTIVVCSRETVAQMIQGGHRVIDNPVYLSDLGNYSLNLRIYDYQTETAAAMRFEAKLSCA